jgi:hypothetical protein
LGSWWIRKFGALTIVGFVATVINFALGGGVQFLGFTVAAIFFDIIISFIGHGRIFTRSINTVVSMMTIAILSAAIAGAIIGIVFMGSSPLLFQWGGVFGWVGLHMIGGIIGGFIGISLVSALNRRKIIVNNKASNRY